MKKANKIPTLNEIVEMLAERTGKQFDHGFKEELKIMVHLWRQRLLVDSLNSRPDDREFFKVWFDLPLVEVPISDFPGFSGSCIVKRTAQKVPRPLRANSTLFDFVGFLNKAERLPMSKTMETVKVLMGGRFTGKVPRSLYINEHIYTFNYLGPGIAIAMIPEDMTQVPTSPCEGSKESLCYSDDKPYAVSGDIAQRIIQAILSTELARGVVPSNIKANEIPVNDEQN